MASAKVLIRDPCPMGRQGNMDRPTSRAKLRLILVICFNHGRNQGRPHAGVTVDWHSTLALTALR